LQDVYLSLQIDLERYNGNADWELPLPARYLIDQSGTVRYAAVNPDHTCRPEPSETLAAIRELVQ
jgi:peroxiredoxin